MDLVPIHFGRVFDGRVQIQLAAGALVGERLDDASGRHPDDGFDQAAELVVRLVLGQHEVGLEGRCVGDPFRGLGAAAGQEHHEAR